MLIFDFDGIMVNSVDEVVLTALNAHTGQLFIRHQDTPAAYPELFRRNRYHIQPAADMATFAGWCLEMSKKDPAYHLSKEEFIEILAQVTISKKERAKVFFAARSRFIKEHRQEWLSLHSVYQPLWGVLCRRSEEIVILTNKNREAVLELAGHFGLTLCPENIYSGDGGMTKERNFAEIKKRFFKEQFSFIDDSIKNLLQLSLSVEGRGVEMLLGSWGYVGPGDIKTANEHGFLVLKQEDLIERMCRSQGAGE